jgi:hypothetical protein
MQAPAGPHEAVVGDLDHEGSPRGARLSSLAEASFAGSVRLESLTYPMAGCSDCANLHAVRRLFNTGGTMEFRSIRALRQDLYLASGQESVSSTKFAQIACLPQS